MHILVAVLTNEKIKRIDREEYKKLLKEEEAINDFTWMNQVSIDEYRRRWKQNKDKRDSLF